MYDTAVRMRMEQLEREADEWRRVKPASPDRRRRFRPLRRAGHKPRL